MQNVNPAYYILNPEKTNCGHSYHQPPVDIRRWGDATPTRDRLQRLESTYFRAGARYIICATQAPAHTRVYYIYYITLTDMERCYRLVHLTKHPERVQ